MKNHSIKYVLLAFAGIFLCIPGFGQTIKGTVYSMEDPSHKTPLPGANIYWENTTKGVASDEKGNFKIDHYKAGKKLICSFMGYKNDSISIPDGQTELEILMYPTAKSLNSFTITDQASKNFLEKSNPLNTEIISGKDLVKAACCNLSGKF